MECIVKYYYQSTPGGGGSSQYREILIMNHAPSSVYCRDIIIPNFPHPPPFTKRSTPFVGNL
jgi:hypothetical protein